MHFQVTILLAVLCVAQCKLLNLTCGHIRKFVNGHNARRMLLAEGKLPDYPPAAEMKLMVWDEELAAKAAVWANINKHIHNPDKTIGSKRFKTGENIYWFSTTADNYQFDLDMSLKSWWDEFKLWRYAKLTVADFSNESKDIGHYTQMAWSNSNRLGCAISNTVEKEWTKFFVVCNYGPAGNYIHEYPYVSGAPSRLLKCTGNECVHQYGDKCSKSRQLTVTSSV